MPRSCASAAALRPSAPPRATPTTPCVSELEDAKAGLDECRENGFQDDLAYGELMVTKLGLTQLTKQFDIATGYAEPDPEPYQYQPKEDKPAE